MKEVAEKVRLIIDVDQQVHKVGPLQPRLDEILGFLYCIRLLLLLQSREVELTLLAIDPQHVAIRHPPINPRCDAFELFVQLGKITIGIEG
jgi:hypothetical protein